MDGYVSDIEYNEEARLNALRDLDLLDTSPSESFDRLTRLASRLLDAPVSTISLTDRDRQWFKSKVGVDLDGIPREQAPCSYAIEGDDVFVVPDLLADPRFVGSPLAQAGIRFYAGAPLFTRQGHGLGTLCVVDDKVRDLDEDGRQVLRDLAGMVMAQVELQNTIGRVDASTGLANQHALLEDIEELAARHPGEEASALILEIASQHQTGQGQRVMGGAFTDALIRGAAARLRLRMGNTARLYQVAQTRCAVVLSPQFGGSAEDMSAALVELLGSPIDCDGIPVTPNPSVGRCAFVLGKVPPRDVLRRLFNALEDAIASDGAEADYSAVRDHEHARSFMLLNDFQAALESVDQLALHYQPRIDLASGSCVGAEGLLRWTHPIWGPVPPFDFIPALEQTALMRPLTEWVLRTALAQIRIWDRAGLELQVSVNVSARNLDEADFADRVLRLAREAQVEPSRLELEFTESAVARNGSRVIGQLQQLREAGIVIAIDDFGSGYSNLSYLQKLPASILKIDRTFVGALETSERDRTLVRSVVAMAQDLGYRVVAEGIETQATFELLRDWGCEEGQGYLMAKPMPVAALGPWMKRRAAGTHA